MAAGRWNPAMHAFRIVFGIPICRLPALWDIWWHHLWMYVANMIHHGGRTAIRILAATRVERPAETPTLILEHVAFLNGWLLSETRVAEAIIIGAFSFPMEHCVDPTHDQRSVENCTATIVQMSPRVKPLEHELSCKDLSLNCYGIE